MKRFLVLLFSVVWLFGGESLRRTPVVLAVERVDPSVVNISTEQIIRQRYDPFFGPRDRLFDELFEEFFGRGFVREYKTTNLGSGVIIDPDGYIVTNEHVVRKASKIFVTTHDKTKVEGKLLSASPEHDLAVVKIETDKPLKAIKFGNSNELMIGEPAIALGNPFGLENTVTVGVISARNRSVIAEGKEVFKDLLQTDAAINPGNSGGPLVNIKGELIGINTAIYAGAQGIGFAIPSDRVRRVLGELLDYRQLRRVWLGVKLQELERDLATALSLPRKEGVLVVEVEKDSPAERAGLSTNALVVSADGREVSSLMDFNLAILKHNRGDKIKVRALRNGNSEVFSVELTALPTPPPEELIFKKLGLRLREPTDREWRGMAIRKGIGLVITTVKRGSPAYKAGIKAGDLLVQVGQYVVTGSDQLAGVLQGFRRGSVVPVSIMRGRWIYVVRLPVME